MYSAVRRTLNDVEGAEEILSGYFFPALAHGIGIRFGPAGFPNGRRLADDVGDIALRVAVGGVLAGNQRRASHNSSNCNVLPNNALADGVNVDEVNTDLATDGVANFKVKSLLVSGLGTRGDRPSIPPEKLLRALLLQQVLCTIRSERLLS